MNIPDNLMYTKDHEWAKIDGKNATIGITDYAQSALGDITYADLPKPGDNLTKSKFCATVESVKAASDVYAPFSGKVTEVNTDLSSHPELINQSPYDKGWFAVIEISDTTEKNDLMSAADYKKYLQEKTK